MRHLKQMAVLAIGMMLSIADSALASCGGQNPPTVTSISPSFGPISGGTLVTISGASLGCVTVSFGNVTTTNVTESPTSVTVISPSGVVGSIVVTVTNPPAGGGTQGPFAGASTTTQFSYITTADAPINILPTAADGQISVAFTSPMNTGGSTITDYEYRLDSGNWVSAGVTTSPVVITGLTNGTTYNIALRAVNAAGAGTASQTASATTPSPQSAFTNAQDVVHAVIQNEIVQSLQSTIAANHRMTRDARDRFLAEQMSEYSTSEQADIPLQMNGSLDVDNLTISSKGSFHGEHRIGERTRLVRFGNFEIQNHGNSGSSTAAFHGRVAWEQTLSDKAMLGYFIGGELARSDIAGSFDGYQTRASVTVGGYAVHELASKILVNGFFSLDAGMNNLEMTDAVLALASDYSTRSALLGAALSGVVEQDGFEVHPELLVSFGRTWIGNVGFTGGAFSLVDDTLSLDVGTVSLASAMFRPELRIPLDG